MCIFYLIFIQLVSLSRSSSNRAEWTFVCQRTAPSWAECSRYSIFSSRTFYIVLKCSYTHSRCNDVVETYPMILNRIKTKWNYDQNFHHSALFILLKLCLLDSSSTKILNVVESSEGWWMRTEDVSDEVRRKRRKVFQWNIFHHLQRSSTWQTTSDFEEHRKVDFEMNEKFFIHEVT